MYKFGFKSKLSISSPSLLMLYSFECCYLTALGSSLDFYKGLIPKLNKPSYGDLLSSGNRGTLDYYELKFYF